MPVSEIALKPSFDASRIPNQSAATVVNMYAEPMSGKGPFPLVGYPGRKIKLSALGPVRGYVTPPQGGFYGVAGQTLYRVNSDWSVDALGTLPGLDLVEIIYNRNQMGFVANGGWYVYTFASGTFAQVTTTQSGFPFLGASSASALDNIGILASPGGDRFYVTDIDDFTIIRDLSFATAESKADPLIAVRTYGGELWLGGPKSIEYWVKTGAANFPYERRNVSSNWGVVSRDTCRNVGETILFVGTDADNGGYDVFRMEGYGLVSIGTPPVTRLLERSRYPERARAVVWRIESHAFYELTTDAGSVVYDLLTGQWHQSAFGVWDYASRQPPPSRLTTQAFVNGKNILGTSDGLWLEVGFDVVNDGNDPMARVFVTPALGSRGGQLAIFRVGLEIENGLGSLTTDPQVWMRYSGDGAHTWGRPQTRGMGKQGKYRALTTWGPQGQAADGCLMFGSTDAYPLKVTNCWASVEARANR